MARPVDQFGSLLGVGMGVQVLDRPGQAGAVLAAGEPFPGRLVDRRRGFEQDRRGAQRVDTVEDVPPLGEVLDLFALNQHLLEDADGAADVFVAAVDDIGGRLEHLKAAPHPPVLLESPLVGLGSGPGLLLAADQERPALGAQRLPLGGVVGRMAPGGGAGGGGDNLVDVLLPAPVGAGQVGDHVQQRGDFLGRPRGALLGDHVGPGRLLGADGRNGQPPRQHAAEHYCTGMSTGPRCHVHTFHRPGRHRSVGSLLR